MKRRWASSISALSLVILGCSAKPQQSDSERSGPAVMAKGAECTPRVLQLERSVDIQVLSEWVTASLYVSGCAEKLNQLSPEQRGEVTRTLKDEVSRGQIMHLKACDLGKSRAADPGVLATINSRIGDATIDDWCWQILSVHGPV